MNEKARPARWIVGPLLERRRLTAYALAKASGLAMGTVYLIANGKARQVTLQTLGALAAGLERLTGEPITPNDLLEFTPDAPGERDG